VWPSLRRSKQRERRNERQAVRAGIEDPAGTPTTVIALLNREIVAILHLPEVVERLSGQGAEALGSTPEEFAAYIRSESVKWAKVVRESGAKAE
jgi:tripartite-type tricarboxylate transporter receptor subunit TctC